MNYLGYSSHGLYLIILFSVSLEKIFSHDMMTIKAQCRDCGSKHLVQFLDLGSQPPANRFLAKTDLGQPEPAYPLEVYWCNDCNLAQLVHVVDKSELFRNYVYFSAPIDLVSKIKELLQVKAPFGIYHITNQGQCSWYAYAKKVSALTRTRATLEPITSAESGSALHRPDNSVLLNAKLATLGIPLLRSWDDALTEYVHELGLSIITARQGPGVSGCNSD